MMEWITAIVESPPSVVLPPRPSDPEFTAWSAPQRWWHYLPVIDRVRLNRLVAFCRQQHLDYEPVVTHEPVIVNPFQSGAPAHAIFAGRDGSGMRSAVEVWLARLPREAQVVVIGEYFGTQFGNALCADAGRPVQYEYCHETFSPLTAPQVRFVGASSRMPFDRMELYLTTMLDWWQQHGTSQHLVLVWYRCPAALRDQFVNEIVQRRSASNVHCWLMDGDLNALCDDSLEPFCNAATITAVFQHDCGWTASSAAARRLADVAPPDVSPQDVERQVQQLHRCEVFLQLGIHRWVGHVLPADAELKFLMQKG